MRLKRILSALNKWKYNVIVFFFQFIFGNQGRRRELNRLTCIERLVWRMQARAELEYKGYYGPEKDTYGKDFFCCALRPLGFFEDRANKIMRGY